MVSENVLEFSGRVRRVVVHHDGTNTQGGVERDHVLSAVRQHNGDSVPRLHAESAQTFSHAGYLLPQLGIRGLSREEVDGNVRAKLRNRMIKHVDEGLVNGRQICGHPSRIRAQPRTVGKWMLGHGFRLRCLSRHRPIVQAFAGRGTTIFWACGNRRGCNTQRRHSGVGYTSPLEWSAANLRWQPDQPTTCPHFGGSLTPRPSQIRCHLSVQQTHSPSSNLFCSFTHRRVSSFASCCRS